MCRLVWAAVMVMGLAAPVAGAERPAEVKLRGWYVGLQSVSSSRNTYDVFARAGLPTGEVDDQGRGGGFLIGHRFGDRFLLGLQATVGRHEVDATADEIFDVEGLITGTVLFRQTSTLQPFLRGGFGGTVEVMQLNPDAGQVFSLGTAAIAGGGLQVRLSSRFSLELEAVATFANFLEVHAESTADPWPQDSWQVRASNQGWRIGTGVMFWF